MNKTLLCSALMLLLCGGASAETVYRHVDAEGNVSFSSEPPAPGEKPKAGEKVEAIEIDPDRNVVAPHVTPETQQLEAQERERYWSQQQIEQQEQQQRNAQIQAAEERLRAAQQAREAGQALQPGDLIGKQGGGTRPSQQRIERLQRLDDDVAAAQENLEQVRRGQ